MGDMFRNLFIERVDFANNVFIIGLGYVLRRRGCIAPDHLGGLQMVTFTLCLPSLMLGLLWSATIKVEFLYIAALSSVYNLLSVSCVSVLVRFLKGDLRGFYSMVATANSLSYVIPVVLASPRFGKEYVPIVLMWELGGNIWVSNLYYGMAASFYAPVAQDSDNCSLSSAADNVDGRTNSQDQPHDPSSHAPPEQFGAPAVDPTDIELTVDHGFTNEQGRMSTMSKAVDTESAIPVSSLGGVAALGARWCRRFCKVLRTPMLMGTCVGALLNVFGVPVYRWPGEAISALSAAFPPLLYAFLGASLRFKLGKEQYIVVLKALLIKWMMNGCFALLLRTLLPFDDKTRGVITLCLVGPIATPFMMYIVRHDYPVDLATMVYNISALISIFGLSLLVQVV